MVYKPYHWKIKKIIIEGNAELLVQEAETFGRAIATAGLTTSQIRKIFGTVKNLENKLVQGDPAKIQDVIVSSLILLKPKLAYTAARHKDHKGAEGLCALTDVLSDAVTQIAASDQKEQTQKQFERFVDFFEAVLAYHRAAGGRRN